MEYPAFEVIVVDNAPKTRVTEEFLATYYPNHPIIRYVREDHPGQSWARNRGVVEARGEMVVYTDDDVVVDRFWLAELIKGFTLTDRVACVTGFVMPMELETHAQALFEQSGGFSKSGMQRRIYDLDTHRPTEPPLSLIYPFTSGLFGSGNNMAFRTDFLREIGGFETALGPGVYAFGEDLLSFFEVIARGYRLVYEPSAICYHKHREDYAGLCTQIFNYGTALTAYPTWILLNYPQHAVALLWKARHALAYLKSNDSLKNRKKRADFPAELSNLERKGMLAGPWLYLRGIMRSRSHEKRFGRLNLRPQQRLSRLVQAVTTALLP
jgi:glycosyltransferase involved in cell wall biosynthesis